MIIFDTNYVYKYDIHFDIHCCIKDWNSLVRILTLNLRV